MNRIVQLMMCAGLLFTVGCYTPRLETTWRNADVEAVSFRKIGVVVLSGSPGERRAQEDEIVNEIEATPAVASYTFVSDSDLRSRETVVQLLRQHGCDAAVVLRLIVPDKPPSYVPGQVNYFQTDADFTYEPPQTARWADTIDAPVRAEFSLYSVADGRLLWAGSTSAPAPANARELSRQVARESVAELRRQGIVW